MSKQSMVYLGLYCRIEPPLIGICYKNRPQDEKKKMYHILLQKLVLNPNIEEVVDQLYHEHPHILKQDKIPKEKIANIFSKIQAELNLGDEDYEQNHQGHQEEEQEEQQQEYHGGQQQHQQQQHQIQRPKPKFDKHEFDFDDEGPRAKLNRSG